MKPCPLETRLRIVGAVDQQFWTIEEIAEMFNVSERYVYKLLALRRETGDLTPRPHGGGAVAKLVEKRLLKLAELVAAQPDATLNELCVMINRRQSRKVTVSTVCRGLQKIDITVKKRPNEPEKQTQRNKLPFGASRRGSPPSGSG
jgi:transposase